MGAGAATDQKAEAQLLVLTEAAFAPPGTSLNQDLLGCKETLA